MNIPFLPARLLISFADAGGGKYIVKATNSSGGKGGTILCGQRVEDGGAREIVLTLMWDEAPEIIAAVERELAENPFLVGGAALLMNVTHSFLWRNAGLTADDALINNEGEPMQPEYMLLVSITNHGEAESLMEAARKAGARGGTIVNARGTGTEADLKYFGICLAPEKEILLIVCETTMADDLLQALASQPLFSEPGGGVLFSAAIDRFIMAGRDM